MSRFKKQVNPEFKEFIILRISKIEQELDAILKRISGKKYESVYRKRFDEILDDFNANRQDEEGNEIKVGIKLKFELYSSKFKYYTEETEKSLRKFGFLINELSEELKFNHDAYEKDENEIYLLNIVNKWSIFNGSVKELFYNIEHSDYPYTIHTVFSLAFVLVPFLNIFSLVGGIYLITHKDWRALTFGAIILILYFIQIISGAYLMLYG